MLKVNNGSCEMTWVSLSIYSYYLRKRERISIHVFTLQIPTKRTPWEFNSGQIQLIEPSLLPPWVCINSKLKSGDGARD